LEWLSSAQYTWQLLHKKTHVLPLLGTKKNRKTTFYVASKKSLVTKVVGLRKMHMSAKNGVKIQKFAMELAKNHGHMVESLVNSSLVVFFVKSFSMKPWYALFGIFPR
jgi:hypothetical protein